MRRSPGSPDYLPTGLDLTFSHIPTDRHAALRTGPGADEPAVDFRKTHFGCVSLKIDSRAAKVNPIVMTFRTWPKIFFRGQVKPARGVGAEIQKGASRDHGGSRVWEGPLRAPSTGTYGVMGSVRRVVIGYRGRGENPAIRCCVSSDALPVV